MRALRLEKHWPLVSTGLGLRTASFSTPSSILMPINMPTRAPTLKCNLESFSLRVQVYRVYRVYSAVGVALKESDDVPSIDESSNSVKAAKPHKKSRSRAAHIVPLVLATSVACCDVLQFENMCARMHLPDLKIPTCNQEQNRSISNFHSAPHYPYGHVHPAGFVRARGNHGGNTPC